MTTSSEHVGSPAQPEPAGLNLLSDKAKATVEEIKAENAALKEADGFPVRIADYGLFEIRGLKPGHILRKGMRSTWKTAAP